MNFLHYGNKAALLIGVLLMIADSVFPASQEFGAWQIGCLFCVWYSVSAIREDARVSKKLRLWLYAYLALVFVLAIHLHGSADSVPMKQDRTVASSLRAFGIGSR